MNKTDAFKAIQADVVLALYKGDTAALPHPASDEAVSMLRLTLMVCTAHILAALAERPAAARPVQTAGFDDFLGQLGNEVARRK